MKKLAKKILLTVSLMAVAGFASAHTVSGSVGSATSANAATDAWVVNCYDDGSGAPTKLFIRVNDTATPKISPTLTISASKGGSVVSVTDSTDDNVFSGSTVLSKGAGDYTLSVTKSNSGVKGAENYIGESHCQTSTGQHTGTDITMTQNQ